MTQEESWVMTLRTLLLASSLTLISIPGSATSSLAQNAAGADASSARPEDAGSAVDRRGDSQDSREVDSGPASSEASTKSGEAPDETQAGAEKKDGQKSESTRSEPKQPKLEKATFGGGCFWCIEAVFERIPGVKSVVSGYAGGSVPYPSYEMVCTGLTGHAEVVQIVFDPAIISYETLMKVFFSVHDPTTLNRQEDDFGTQYRSIILYDSVSQAETAKRVMGEFTKQRVYFDPIVTQIVPLMAFYPAEPYHQNYYRTHRGSDYTLIYIEPKLAKLKKLKVGPATSKASASKSSETTTSNAKSKSRNRRSR
jgi:peptide-methionine (S)-S-oxide reductase